MVKTDLKECIERHQTHERHALAAQQMASLLLSENLAAFEPNTRGWKQRLREGLLLLRVQKGEDF